MTERTDETQGQPEDPQSLARKASLDRIAATTYPYLKEQATGLFTRLHKAIDLSEEPLNFGRIALDVGGGNGGYAQVIRELGPERVIVIDPLRAAVKEGIEKGFVKPDEAFVGSLEELASQTSIFADSAFLFNLNPRQAGSIDFANSLMSIVRPGGLVVCSFVEPMTAERFMGNTFYNGRLERVRGLPDCDVLDPLVPHRYIQVGRRTHEI